MKNKDISQLVENRFQQLQAQQETLIRVWDPYIKAIEEHIQEKAGRNMAANEKRAVAQCLQNALDESGVGSVLNEATTEDSIKFLGIRQLCAA